MIIRRILLLFTACVLISVSFTGCRKIESKESSVANTTETIQSVHKDNVLDLINEDDENYGDIEITTPYVKLHYSEKWMNHLKIKKNFEDESNVTFFACIDGKKDIEIFTVHFNEDGEIPLGVLKLESESVYIAFSYSELKYDDTWTQNEKDVVNAMQEQINYIIDHLEKETNFIPEN